ncbi:ionotropic receptor 21a-like [Palaemon carinicauda]|uniref:ionotropic receptor 21a-like n=1 Tax=Palaemon carinicauda TaxID=392227 RepID=UPI0035B663C4
MSYHAPIILVLLFLIIPLLEKSYQKKDAPTEIRTTEDIKSPELGVEALQDEGTRRRFLRDLVLSQKLPMVVPTIPFLLNGKNVKANLPGVLKQNTELTVPYLISEEDRSTENIYKHTELSNKQNSHFMSQTTPTLSFQNTKEETTSLQDTSRAQRKLLSLEITASSLSTRASLPLEKGATRFLRPRAETGISFTPMSYEKEFETPTKTSQNMQTQLEVPELMYPKDRRPSLPLPTNQVKQTEALMSKKNDSELMSTNQNSNISTELDQMTKTFTVVTDLVPRKESILPNQIRKIVPMLANGMVQFKISNQMTQTDLLIKNQITQTDDLTKLLLRVIEKDLVNCELVLYYGENSTNSDILEKLAVVAQQKQILRMDSRLNFASMTWKSPTCRGYIFLWPDLLHILDFLNTALNSWDYNGKYIFAGVSLSDLESIVSSEKGKKTEHIVGLIKSERGNSWRAYVNQLYRQPNIVRVNTWMGNGFSGRKGLFPDKTFDLTGVTLKACIFPWPPSVMYHLDENRNILFRYGLDIAVIEALAGVMNFNVHYFEPPEGERWGEITANGSYNGMIGFVNRGEADIGVGTLFISIMREDYIDYTDPFTSELSCALLQAEKPLPSWQAIAFPFQGNTWLSLMGGLILAGPIFYLLVTSSSKLGTEFQYQDSLSYCWYYVFGMHLNEPQHQRQYMTSTQIYIGFLWLYCMLVTIAYSTNLTAFLTVKKIPRGIESIAELPNSGMHVIGVDDYYQKILKSSPDPNLRALADTYEIQYDANELYNDVQSGQAIFIQNRGFMEYTLMLKFTRQGKPSVRIMKECFISHPVALGVQEHSPLKKRFNQILGRLVNGGLITKFFTDTLRLVKSTQVKGSQDDGDASNSPNEDATSGGIVPLTIEHMQGLFLITATGLGLSVLAFAIERMKAASSEDEGSGIFNKNRH